MQHRLIQRVFSLDDGTSIIEINGGALYQLDADRRQVFHDDLIEELIDVEEDMTVFTSDPHTDEATGIPPVSLIYRSSASPRVYVLSTPDGDFDMNAAEAKAILWGPEGGER